MPDFEKALNARLGMLKLAPHVAQEVIAELAGHLDDAHKNYLAQGLGPEEAEICALREIPAGGELARKIQLAKQGDEQMNNRTKQFWLPALVTSLIGTGLLAFMVNAFRLTPRVVSVSSESSMTIYLPWLFALPFLGFLGAAMSRRAGGAVPARILAAIFLSLIYFALPWLFVPIAMLVDHNTPPMTQVGWFFLNWAVLPGLALLVGALPAALLALKNLEPSQGVIHQ